ncbi:DUF423 domain-containing protein [Rhizobium cremeum]|uniref:DUF423 domain-containing protein n=1 Tax=Rhizobium cremeum TaxID=2813827 RepID=UPI003CC7E4C8
MLSTSEALNRLLPALAGLMGAAGVGLAAAATHTGSEGLLGPASAMCLAHAPALLALRAGGHRIPTATVSGLVLALGTLLFAGDLVSKQFLATRLFPMAAPAGGILMIAGWLIAGAGALFPLRSGQ